MWCYWKYIHIDQCKRKNYNRCDPEFGEHEHSIDIIMKALYGLTTSGGRFSMLADFHPTLGFKQSRLDRDVWMIMRDTCAGYDYICTHVDDLMLL